jgi:hypothetical protein
MNTFNVIMFKTSTIDPKKEIDTLNKYYNIVKNGNLEKYDCFKSSIVIENNEDFENILKALSVNEEWLIYNKHNIDGTEFIIINDSITNIKKTISNYYKENGKTNKWNNTIKKQRKSKVKVEKIKKVEKKPKEVKTKKIINKVIAKENEENIKDKIDYLTDDSDNEFII